MNAAVIIIVTGIIFFLATCLALLDIARKDFGDIAPKAMWAFITLIPFLGPFLYFFIGFRKGRKPEQGG